MHEEGEITLVWGSNYYFWHHPPVRDDFCIELKNNYRLHLL